MSGYRIKNWDQFQHYKDRNPPWIKLHFALLSSEDWVVLDDASRVLAVACMLIASQNDGVVPGNLKYIKRVAYLNDEPDLTPLIDCGFLLPLADASTMQADARPETETEEETEKNPPIVPPKGDGKTPIAKPKKRRKGARDYDPEFLDWWSVYPRRSQKGDAFDAYWTMRDGGHDAETLLAGARHAADKYAGKEEEWIPLPATFLRREEFLEAGEAVNGGTGPPAHLSSEEKIDWWRKYESEHSGGYGHS